MTKIKNTKKGMAKKTLSMSLVVAMLATSNVPVWAAEFSDGTDAAVATEAPAAETFSDETAEAPVVEDNTVDTTSATAVVESSDLNVDISVSKSATFAKNSVAVGGTIKTKEGADLTKFSYGWRVAGDNVAIYTGDIKPTWKESETKGVHDGTSISDMGFAPNFNGVGGSTADWDQYAGKTLELYIFNNATDDDDIKIDPIVIGTTTINKLDVSKASMSLNKASIVYNGKSYYYDENATDSDENAVKLSATGIQLTEKTTAGGLATTTTRNLDSKYFVISASQSAKNAGDVLTVTATPKTDSPYQGTSINVSLTVQKRLFNASEFKTTVEEGLSYQYTGKIVSVPANKITFKETDALSEADLSAAVKKAETVDKDLGTKNVKVTLDTTKLPNFKFSDNETDATRPATKEVTTSGSEANANVTITKRDLSTTSTTVSLKHGRVPYGTPMSVFASDDNLVFTDKNGTVLKLVNGEDYTVSVLDPDNQTVTADGSFDKVGTYKVTLSAKETTNPTCYNGQTFDVRVATNVIGSVTFTNTYKPFYTGTEIKPSKADLGKIVIHNVASGNNPDETLKDDEWEITGYSNNINASKYDANGKATTFGYVEIKVKGDSSYANQTYKVPFEIQPLLVTGDTITVPKTISYNKGYSSTDASDYKVPVVVVAKDATGKIVKTLTADDYTVKYEYVNANKKNGATNEIGDKIQATVTIKNDNYKGFTTVKDNNGQNKTVQNVKVPATNSTEITAKALADNMIKVEPSSYTYTGGNIIPEFYVVDGAIILNEGKASNNDKSEEYEVVSVTNNLNVGTGKVTIKGINDNYSGTASAEFTITAADTSSVKVEIDPQKYTGKSVRPRTFKATLNGNDVTDQFEIISYGENKEAGKGTVVLKPVDGNKNFTGANITAEFNIYQEAVRGNLSVYNKNGQKIGDSNTTIANAYVFDFDGDAKTFATERLNNLKVIDKDGNVTTVDSKATADDFEIKYAENVTGVPNKKADGTYEEYNTAYVYAVAKDGSGYTGNQTLTLADGSKIKNVVASYAFKIKNVQFVEKNVSVKNGTYAGGLAVKPDVLVQIKGQTLVEGKDYELKFYTGQYGKNSYKEISNCTDVTDGKAYGILVNGKGGYTGSLVYIDAAWGIDKKDIKDCDVKVIDGVTTVMNGYIPVPTTEYTSTKNSDGTYTVAANKDSKNYVGSKTVSAQGKAEDEKPDAPMISSVKVVGNKATVILSGESEGASGYDYVISTDRDCITNKDYTSVNKNQVKTNTTFEYVGQNTYYAYCHAWKRDENGKKVFSDWSNAYPFVVSAITPSQPVITSVKVSGSTVTVTYTKASNADGYDVVLGTSTKKVNGETRPVEYGKLVKKNIKGNVVTATFKNVKKGTYYAGLHAFNRTSEDGKKVFSQWSNVKKVNVK